MFGYILGGITAAIFGGIALHEGLKPTGEKLKTGDTAFVNVQGIRVSPIGLNPTEQDIATRGLQTFLAGTLGSDIRVNNCQPATVGVASTSTPVEAGATGSILGFARTVEFPLRSVRALERNGKRIT